MSLKLRTALYGIVAPYAGAWIEICKKQNDEFSRAVAPYAGAWIEMSCVLAHFSLSGPSLPTRERGLKSDECKNFILGYMSLPTRERGLKLLEKPQLCQCLRKSLPTRGRGLKFLSPVVSTRMISRSLRGGVG